MLRRLAVTAVLSVCAQLAPIASAQAIVGYGALTGASGVAAGEAGRAGGRAAETLGRLGDLLNEAEGRPRTSAAPVAAGGPEAAVGADPSLAQEVSVVLRSRWGSVETESADASSPETAFESQMETVSSPPSAGEAKPSDPLSPSLRRGARIRDLIVELGEPDLVVNGAGEGPYDRKYIFHAPDGRRYSVLALRGVVIDWSARR